MKSEKPPFVQRELTRESVFEVLATLDDPELGVDVVDLGLIRDVVVDPDAIAVVMTLTTPACPVGPWMQEQAETRLHAAFPAVSRVVVRVTLDPPWTPDAMSESARSLLGYAPTTLESPMEPTLDIRLVPPPEKHPTIFRTFDALAPGEGFVLVNDHDPKPLRYQFDHERPESFDWEYLQQGPRVWRVRIGRSA